MFHTRTHGTAFSQYSEYLVLYCTVSTLPVLYTVQCTVYVRTLVVCYIANGATYRVRVFSRSLTVCMAEQNRDYKEKSHFFS